MSGLVAGYCLVLYPAETIPLKRKMPRRKPEINLVKHGTIEQLRIDPDSLASIEGLFPPLALRYLLHATTATSLKLQDTFQFDSQLHDDGPNIIRTNRRRRNPPRKVPSSNRTTPPCRRHMRQVHHNTILSYHFIYRCPLPRLPVSATVCGP